MKLNLVKSNEKGEKVNKIVKKITAIAFTITALMVLLAPASVAAAPPAQYVFSTIDYPGAIVTNIWGINAGDDIVGYYRNPTGPTHGFVLSEGVYNSVDFPGSSATTLCGIGNSGEIVGDYLLPGEPTWAWHSFLLTTEGEFIPTDFPGRFSTIPMRILPDGTIIGFARDADLSTKHGVVMSRTEMTEYDLPNSQHNGATPNGKTIVGYYVTGGLTRGYVLDKGNFVPFDVPGSTLTMAYDINPSGRIVVGTYQDTGAKWHGFMTERNGTTVEDWEFTTIDFPGAIETRVWTANAGGDLAGRYVDAAGKWHGFLATPIE
jgi:hypothetical protein